MPDVLVIAVPEESAAEAPLEGVVNVTLTPLAGAPKPSVMVTCRGREKAAPSRADCAIVGEGVMTEIVPARFVREKLVDTPRVVAVTR